jgi:phospholipase/lecithinase/hemolysin
MGPLTVAHGVVSGAGSFRHSWWMAERKKQKTQMKGEIMKEPRMLVCLMRKACLAMVIGLTLLLVGQCVVFAGSTPFSRIIVFGDSTSDTGNFYRMSGGVYPPSPPYWQGHFCNGPVWVEYLAEDLGMAGLLDDYAVGGAATGHENSNVPAFGGVQDQIAVYLSLRQADPNALYILWAGHNDVFIGLGSGESPQALIDQGVGNTLEDLQILWAAGARQILVLNVADLGLTPTIRQYGPAVSASVSALCAAYNQALEAALAAAAIPTIRLDIFAEARRVATPSEFGFTNVTDPYLYSGLQAGADPAQFYFWDDAHTTTRVQRLTADAARNCLVDYYSPRQGRSMPPALANALNGLVHARKGN